MADKFLYNNGGRITEKEAQVTSAGAGDAGKIPALDAAGRLDESVMPVGIGADVATIEASEILASGDLVNIWDDAGTVKVRKADATAAGKEADGFVKDGVASGATATVYFEGQNTSLSGLTAGTRYYLSAATPGGVVSTAPSASGNVSQFVGKAISATTIAFEATDGIVIA